MSARQGWFPFVQTRVLASCLFLTACDRSSQALDPGDVGTPRSVTSAGSAQPSDGRTFATVGGVALPTSLLFGDSVGARKQAAAGIVRDELRRLEAREKLPDQSRAAGRAVLARALREDLGRESVKREPVSAQELSVQRDALWLRVDRPRAVRTAQIFIQVPPLVADESRYQFALKIHEAIRGHHNLEDIAKAAQSIKEEFEIRFLRAPAVTSDGRVIPQQGFDPSVTHYPESYARAAAALTEPGQLSEVVGSEEGFHILFAEEILPAQKMPEEQAQQELMRAAVAARVKKSIEQIEKKRQASVTRVRSDISVLLRSARQEQ